VGRNDESSLDRSASEGGNKNGPVAGAANLVHTVPNGTADYFFFFLAAAFFAGAFFAAFLVAFFIVLILPNVFQICDRKDRSVIHI
jgi:hypothetical protein